MCALEHRLVRRRVLAGCGALVALGALSNACGGPAAAPGASPARATSPTRAPTSPPATAARQSKPYLFISLTDVRTGERFTLGQFAGKVVVVESMAVWCPLCTDQQRVMQAVLPELGPGVVYVSIDVDPNETPDLLRRYVERHGFSWRFAVAPRELAAALADAFGAQVLNPPSTPIVIIDPRGEARLTPFGHKDASALRELVRRARG